MTLTEEVGTAQGLPYEVVCEDTSALTRPEWLALRKAGLGSSDVAPAMDSSPWNSAYALYCDKRNLAPDSEQTEAFEWKLDLETPILNWVERKGWTGPLTRHLMLRSARYPWLHANPDGLSNDAVVEAKTANGWDEKRWDVGVPIQYVLQAHALMAVTGRQRCLIPVAFDTNAPREFWVIWDPAIGEPMLAKTEQFWQRVVDGHEPDPDASEATMFALRSRYTAVDSGAVIELPSDVLDLVRTRDAAQEAVAKHIEIINGVKTKLMSKLGESEVGLVGDTVVCTWNKSERTGKRTFLFKDIEKGALA